MKKCWRTWGSILLALAMVGELMLPFHSFALDQAQILRSTEAEISSVQEELPGVQGDFTQEIGTKTFSSAYSYEDFRGDFFGQMKNISKSSSLTSLFAGQESDHNVTITPSSPEDFPLIQGSGTSTYATPPSYGFGAGETSEREFYISAKSNSLMANATLVAQGDYCNIWWVDPDGSTGTYTGSDAPSFAPDGGSNTNSVAEDLAERLDTIYSKITTEIAPHKNITMSASDLSNMLLVGDVDEDGKVNVVLYDIDEDGDTSNPDSYTYAAGLFYPGDFANKIDNKDYTPIDAVHMDIGYHGGVDSAAFLRTLELNDISEGFYGTFAHELQHLLFYMYFGYLVSYTDAVSNKSHDYLWFNESLSGVVDIFYADYTQTSGQNDQDLGIDRVIHGSGNSYGGSYYGDFVSFNNSLKNYGMSYMFSAMMNEYDSDYIKKIYDYFEGNLTKDSSGGSDYDISATSSQEPYGDLSEKTVLGGIFQKVLNDNNFSSLDPETAFQYVYSAFMESYLSGGGDIFDGEGTKLATTYQIWEDRNQTLWTYRNGNQYQVGSPSNDPYDTIGIASGDSFIGNVTLSGYSGGTNATHEMVYRLIMPTDPLDHTLKINIGESGDNFLAYVAVYDESNYQYKNGPNSSYDINEDHADLYPLVLGADNLIYLEDDDTDLLAMLFVTTFYENVNETVTYSWTTEEITIPTYTITVNSNGGVFSGNTSLTTDSYGRIANYSDFIATSPTKEGYTFGGWYIDSSFNTPLTGNTQFKADSTIYAKWVEIVLKNHDNCACFAHHSILASNWIALTEKNFDTVTSGNYYLAENITGDLAITGDFNLCLNGLTLTSSVISVTNANFALFDGEGDFGTITGGSGYKSIGAYQSGGGIYFSATSGTPTFAMYGGTISGNTATYRGAGISIIATDCQANVEIHGGKIAENTLAYSSYSMYGCYGSGIHIESAATTMNSTINFKMTGGRIENNVEAEDYRTNQKTAGLSLLVTPNQTHSVEGNFQISGGEITGNAKHGLSVVAASNTITNHEINLKVENTTISNSEQYGLYIFSKGAFTGTLDTVTITENGTVTENSTTGGGVYLDIPTESEDGSTPCGEVTLKDIEITQNAGGLYLNSGTVTLESGKISNNTGYEYGGVRILSGRFFMKDGILAENNTTWDATSVMGGGVRVSGGIFTLEGGEISENYARQSGGGVAVTNSGTFVMNGGKISENTVKLNIGTAVVVYQSSANTASFEMNGGTICNHTSDSQTIRLYSESSTGEIQFTMTGGSIENNKTTAYGSGISAYAYSGDIDMEISGGEISGNTAVTYGGGIFASAAIPTSGSPGSVTILLENATIQNNSASYGGGIQLGYPASSATYQVSVTGSIKNSVISGNVASVSGGGIGLGSYNFDNPKLTLENTTLSGNHAEVSGGGLYVQITSTTGTTATLNGVTFAQNTVGTDGLGTDIYHAGTTLTFENKIDIPEELYIAGDSLVTLTNSFKVTNPIPLLMENPGVFTTGASTGQLDLEQFYSLDPAYYVDSITAPPELELTKPTINVVYQNGTTANGTLIITQENDGVLETFADLPTPTYDGYLFLGWYTASTGGENVSDTTHFDRGDSIYAQWIADNLNFVYLVAGEGATVSHSYWELEDSDGSFVLTNFTNLPTPEKEGHSFLGWFTDDTGDDQVESTTIFTNQASIYAQWKVNMYIVTFQNGDVSTTEEVAYGQPAREPSQQPEQEGYTFLGWYADEKEWNFATAITGNLTLTAKWVENSAVTYVVTFVYDNGTEDKEITVEEHTTVSKPTDPEKEGYTFQGWYTVDEDLWDFDAEITKNLTLTAKWEKNTVVTPTPTPTPTPSTPSTGGSSGSSGGSSSGSSGGTTVTPTPDPEPEEEWRYLDVFEGDWYHDPAYKAYYAGYMVGVSPNYFGPEQKITRGMMVTILYALEGKPEVSPTDHFVDVTESDYYYFAVAWAVEHGVSAGYSANYFMPDVFIPREQILVMLYGYANHLSLVDSNLETFLSFTDSDNISDWAKNAVAWGVTLEMVSGRYGGIFDPHASATRGEVVVILDNFVDYMEKTSTFYPEAVAESPDEATEELEPTVSVVSEFTSMGIPGVL